jgi:FMN phosphatase YigB (HAD superfamily)/ribosomal protein S18 acetylase RimI-like enzyme
VVDFDNTLFDVERFKSHLTSKFRSKSEYIRIYKSAKKAGYFVPEELPDAYRNLFLKASFKKFLFPKSVELVRNLKKLGTVLVFSFGDKGFQHLKIKETGIEKLVGKSNVIISQDKKLDAGKLIQKLGAGKFSEIVMIDDVAQVLEQGFRKLPKIITVWIRYGRFKNKLPITRNSVTIEVGSLEGAVEIIQRLVGTISLPKSHLKYPVLRGISKGQITDLVSYTGRDKKVSLCTHDDGRFKSVKTFTSWQKRGKIIYTLVGRTGKLLGIIWFAKKKYKNYPFTFAIRLYPPVRGKGLSYKFATEAFEDFKTKYKVRKLWLSRQGANIAAEKLYKKMGFSESEERRGEVVMTYPKS